MCGQLNEVMAEHFSPTGDNGKRMDLEQHPQLSSGSVELIAPAEYMVSQVSPASVCAHTACFGHWLQVSSGCMQRLGSLCRLPHPGALKSLCRGPGPVACAVSAAGAQALGPTGGCGVQVRAPMPPSYMFVIDVSVAALACGMLEAVVDGIKAALDELMANERTMVGFLTFDTSLHFYNLKAGLAQPQMLVRCTLLRNARSCTLGGCFGSCMPLALHSTLCCCRVRLVQDVSGRRAVPLQWLGSACSGLLCAGCRRDRGAICAAAGRPDGQPEGEPQRHQHAPGLPAHRLQTDWHGALPASLSTFHGDAAAAAWRRLTHTKPPLSWGCSVHLTARPVRTNAPHGHACTCSTLWAGHSRSTR